MSVWAARLGFFLYTRVRREGGDRRFDRIKQSAPRFAMAWTLQALWVFVTLSCALAAITSTQRTPLGLLAALGAVVWAAGFAIEAIADAQKRRFRADPAPRPSR